MTKGEQVRIPLDNYRVVTLAWNPKRKALVVEVWTLAHESQRSVILEGSGLLDNSDGSLEELINPIMRAWCELHPHRKSCPVCGVEKCNFRS
jgi:hypothetical protein